MLSLLILLLILLTGYLIMSQLVPTWPGVMRIAAGWLTGVLLYTWMALTLITISNYDIGIISTALVFGVVSLYLITIQKPTWTTFNSLSIRLSLAAILIFWGSLFGWLFYTHMFQPKVDGLYSGGSSWGDMALHATLINKFAGQSELDLTSPIYASHTTNYPFLFDFFTALIYRGGFTLSQTLAGIGLVTSLSIILLMFFLAWKITGKVITGWLFTWLFMANGGLGVYYFWRDWVSSETSLWNFLTHMELSYAHLGNYYIHWSNVISDGLLPQRGLLIGLAIFCLIILLWYEWWQQPKRPQLLYASSLLISLLPLFHVHTFFSLFGMLVWIIGFGWWSKRLTIRQSIIVLILTLLPAVAQFWWMFSNTPDAHQFVRFQTGWMESPYSFIAFWIWNMGVGFLFFTLGSIYFFHFVKGQQFIKVLLAPLLVLFIICNLVIFQPYDYDNIKFLYLSYWGVMLMVSVLLTCWWQHKQYFLVIFLVILMTLAGTLAILRETQTSWMIASSEEVEVAQQINAKTDPTSIFLTSDAHNHLVPMLAGRSVVLGYRGWLWTHGIDYSQTEADVAQMFAGGEEAKLLLNQYHVDYVYIGPKEKSQYNVNQKFFDDNFTKEVLSEEENLYQTQI